MGVFAEYCSYRVALKMGWQVAEQYHAAAVGKCGQAYGLVMETIFFAEVFVY